eukprot:7071191-Pyramimonas_sp.AAC.1
MVRATGTKCTKVPPGVRELLRFFQNSSRADYDGPAGSIGAGGLARPCLACADSGDGVGVATCPLCMSTMHAECAARVAAKYSHDGDIAVERKCVSREVAMLVSTELLCACCARVIDLSA